MAPVPCCGTDLASGAVVSVDGDPSSELVVVVDGFAVARVVDGADAEALTAWTGAGSSLVS